MNWMAFVASLVGSLAWPIAATVIVLVFRKELKKLIPDIRHFKAGPLAADFGRALEEVEEQVEDVEEAEDLPQREFLVMPPDPLEIAVKLADTHPPAAVVEGWKVFEEELREGSRRMNLDGSARLSDRRLLKDLIQRDLLPKGIDRTVDELRRLRNVAAHNPALALSKSQALEYVDVLRRIIYLVRDRLAG